MSFYDGVVVFLTIMAASVLKYTSQIFKDTCAVKKIGLTDFFISNC